MSENKHEQGWLGTTIEEQVSESSSLCLLSEFRWLLNPLQGHVLAQNLSGSWSPRMWSSESFNIKYKLTSLAFQPTEATSSHQCCPASIFVSPLSECMVARCDHVTCLGEQNHERKWHLSLLVDMWVIYQVAFSAACWLWDSSLRIAV